MATIHRLNSDWTLTDGIIEPIRLDRPMSIYDALRRENLVPDAHYGMNLNACEWINNHTFTYEKKFDLPPSNDTERTELRFEKMVGKCIVRVNDQVIEPFVPGRYDITGAVQPTGNLLRVMVYQTGAHGPVFRYPIGISGSVSITGTSRITVIREEFSVNDELCCDLTILAHISGKFRFTCVISREGEPIATHETHQRFIAAEQNVSLRFPLPENASGMYDVQLTIEHNGLLCDRLRGTFAIPVKVADEAVCNISGDSNYDVEPAIIALLPLLKNAGFTSISFSFKQLRTRRVATKMQELGLNLTKSTPMVDFLMGCMSLEALTKYAAGTPLPVAWRLRNGPAGPNIDKLSGTFGKITRENFAAAIRLNQASKVFSTLVNARKAGETPKLLCTVDGFPVFYSESLMDAEGPRPALYAAKQALQRLLAIAECDDVLPHGRVLKIPVLLLARNVRPLPVSVTATMYTPQGGVISSVSFSAMPGGETRLGELNVEIPADLRYALLRTAVEASGEAPVVVDQLISCGDKPMLPADLPKTTLIDGRCGDNMAYGVVTNTGIRILLPGETADGCTGEYFNC